LFPFYLLHETAVFPKQIRVPSSPGQERIAKRKSSIAIEYACHPHQHRCDHNILIPQPIQAFFNIQVRVAAS
jgi:hypothetical protein